jgi:hypothetical protein
MNEIPHRPNWQNRLENHSESDSRSVAGFVVLLGFLLRLWRASGTFLNPDEAMHFLAANRLTLADAYRASLNLAHPPLLILLLNLWRRLGTSEPVLRLPSVIAGTIFCWICFKWVTRLLGPTAGRVGFVLVSFLPPFVELSAEVRQYALLLCFLMASSHALELALTENSSWKMLPFFVFLYLAMLTHFSAILFAGAVGIYSLWRLVSAQISWRVRAVWAAGQAGALALLFFLYTSQIANLQHSIAAQHMRLLLANSYFHWGHDHLAAFIFARTFGVLQYAFGQLAVGDIAGVLCVAGMVLLVRGTPGQQRPEPSPRQIGVLLLLPFAINCAAAIADLYPYGGTRHSAFLLPFAIAGVSAALAKLTRKPVPAIGVVVLVIVICWVFGAPHRPYMRREDQRRANMTQAIDAIRRQASPQDVIYADFQSSFLLRFYLCPDSKPGNAVSGLLTYRCGEYSLASTTAETNILSAETFLHGWNDMLSTNRMHAGQRVWIFQAGWDIALARELQKGPVEFHGLRADFFGRNISLFQLTVGQPVSEPASKT